MMCVFWNLVNLLRILMYIVYLTLGSFASADCVARLLRTLLILFKSCLSVLWVTVLIKNVLPHITIQLCTCAGVFLLFILMPCFMSTYVYVGELNKLGFRADTWSNTNNAMSSSTNFWAFSFCCFFLLYFSCSYFIFYITCVVFDSQFTLKSPLKEITVSWMIWYPIQRGRKKLKGHLMI